MNKAEALKKIEDLKEFIEGCDNPWKASDIVSGVRPFYDGEVGNGVLLQVVHGKDVWQFVNSTFRPFFDQKLNELKTAVEMANYLNGSRYTKEAK